MPKKQKRKGHNYNFISYQSKQSQQSKQNNNRIKCGITLTITFATKQINEQVWIPNFVNLIPWELIIPNHNEQANAALL